ncbi:MAG: undecaprenyl-diphosphate phosphatase [Pseudomonadota bacterium]
MPLFHLVLVALIQGITEFLPVSSSGHLVLLPLLTGLDDQGLVIDVAAHVGTLFAVVIYFWSDVKLALFGTLRLVRGKVDTQGAWLALCLVIATVPVVIVGFVLSVTGLDEVMRSVTVIGWTMLVFGLVLYWADQRAPQVKTQENLSLKDALILGLWQVLALIPGTSRSGITITGALAQGFTRADGARIAMLMSIPVIIASGAIASLDLIGGQVPLRDAGIVVGLSFLSALAALALMMRLLKSVSFTPYVIYRVILGVILLYLGYSGAITP